ncbi:MAG: hypothetical protein FWE88_07170 [Phycisphaerae bacterium]|nr:hypothetical protein [Phycisphaerae bacterium]
MSEKVLEVHRADYPESFLLPDKSTPVTGETKHNCPGYVTFANEFSYFMDYSGQGYGYIHKNEGWRCDINYTLADILTGYAMRPCVLAETPEGLDRLYQAVGFPARQTFYANPDKKEHLNNEEMKDHIKYALCTLEQPVILRPVEGRFFGAVIIGYKEGGDVLVTFGYPPYFAAPDNRKPQIAEIRNWYQNNTTITIVGKRQAVRPVKEVYYEGIVQVRDYLHAGVHGKDAHYYDEWERFLRLSMDDMIREVRRLRYVPGAQMFANELPQGEITDQQIRQRIHAVADPTWCEMAERRYYIMHFFYQAAQYFPEEKEALKEIEDHFAWSNTIMGSKYIKEAGHDPVTAAFENIEVRSRMADCVREFREADAKGLEMVEKLLTRLRMGICGLPSRI